MQNPYLRAIGIQDACNASGVMMTAPALAEAVGSELKRFDIYSTDNFKRHPIVVLFADKLADLAGLDHPGIEPFGRAYELAKDIEAGAVTLGSPEHKSRLLHYYSQLDAR